MKNILGEYFAKTYKIDSYFYDHYNEKIQVHKNGRECILFRIDVYFTKYLLAVEIDEKNHAQEKTRSTGKKPNCEFIRIIRGSVMLKIMKLVE